MVTDNGHGILVTLMHVARAARKGGWKNYLLPNVAGLIVSRNGIKENLVELGTYLILFFFQIREI